MAGLGIFEGVLMVSDELIMMTLAMQFGFMAFILMKLDLKKSEANQMKKDIENTLGSIKIPELNLDAIKDDLIEVVEDLMQNMRIPSIADHLGGAVAQFMSMKNMKMAHDFGLAGPLGQTETEEVDED